jgi:hypothetical protein
LREFAFKIRLLTYAARAAIFFNVRKNEGQRLFRACLRKAAAREPC